MSLQDTLKEKRAKIGSTPARIRIASLFDSGNFTEIDTFAKSGENAASVIVGYGYIGGSPVYAFSQDKTVMNGAVGKVQAEKIKKIFDLAAKTGAPVVGIYDSNGASLNEGIDSLSAYGEMLYWSNRISGVVPQISVIAGTCAGAASIIAASADIIIMSEKAEFFLTPPSMAEDKNGPKIGTAESNSKSGTIHLTEKDDISAVLEARLLISKLPLNNLSPSPISEFAESADAAGALAAAPEKIFGGDYDINEIINNVVDSGSVIELQPEFGKSAVTAFATVTGNTVGIVALSGGCIDSDTCVKIARFVRICDSFSIPVVTFVDTLGFERTAEEEKNGIVREASKLSNAYAEATTPKISFIIGKAYGAAYVTLAGISANADLVFAWPSAEISPLQPEAAVSILWNDRLAAGEKREDLVQEYRKTNSSPFIAAQSNQIHDVIDSTETRSKLISALDILSGKRISTLPKKHSNIQL